MTEEVWTEIKSGIAQLRFNRPELRNALSMIGVREVITFLRAVERDESVRCMLVCGAGPHFMAGGNMQNFLHVLAEPEEVRAASFEQRAVDQSPIWVSFERLKIPVVCSVRGYAVGAALSFVGAADLAIASDTAKFILGHIGIGLPPDAGTSYYLPRAVGQKRARQIAFLGEPVTASEALSMGLVNWVVPDAELETRTLELVGRLTRAPSMAIAEGRRLLNMSLYSNISEQLSAEAEAFARCGLSCDLKEGVTAFMEKRKPNFTGR